MKNLVMIALTILCTVLGGIEVSGNQSGTWTSDNNPYQVVGDITVPSGSTLEIEAGVNVEVMGDYRIQAEGCITAIGTDSAPVSFYSPTESQWTGIRLDNDQTDNQLQYCVIQHAEYGVNILHTQVLIRYCHFNNNEKGIQVFGLNEDDPPLATIRNNLIENCQQNGILIVESNPYITDNYITQCALDGTARAGIQLSCQSNGGICMPTIENNAIYNNVWQGITAWDIYASGTISPIVRNNIIEQNLTGVYLYDASGYFYDNVIRDNFVSGNANSGAGVMLYGSTTFPTFARNIITGNFCGFYIINGAGADLGNLSDADTDNDGRNIIYGNIDETNTTYSIYSGSTQQIKAENCFWDSPNPDEIDDTIIGNVDYDPLYSTEYTAVSYITGNYPETENEVEVFLYDAITYQIASSAQLLPDYEYFLSVPQTGAYYVFAIEHAPDGDRYGISLDFNHVDMYIIFENTNGYTADIWEFADEIPLTIEVSQPFDHDGTEYYPLYISMSVFFHQQMFLAVEDEGIRIGGFAVYETGELDTLWLDETAWFVRNDDPQPGDTWVSADIIDGEVAMTEAVVAQSADDNFLVVDYYYNDQLDTRRVFESGPGMVSQMILDDWALDMDNELDESAIYGGDGYFPVYIGNVWCMTNPIPPIYPHDLYFWQIENAQHMLVWDPPAPVDDAEWQGYRVYQDDVLLADLAFEEFWYEVEVPAGEHEYYITAYTADGETDPTNTITIEYLSIQDDPEPSVPFVLDIYPNPMNLSRQDGMSFSIASQKAPTVSLYNVRGQKIRSWTPEKDASGKYMIRWDGSDQAGKTVSSGIYFARVEGSKQTLVKKVILLR